MNTASSNFKIVPKKATEKKAEPKKVYPISIKFGYSEGTSIIIRNDLPSLIDNTEKSVAWLKANNFKEADIEIIGSKPDCWETYYPVPVVEPTPLVEKISEVLDGTPAPADTMAVTTVNLDSGTIVQEQVKDVFEGIPVAPVVKSDPAVDPILKSLGIPEANVTTLTDVFVPPKVVS